MVDAATAPTDPLPPRVGFAAAVLAVFGASKWQIKIAALLKLQNICRCAN